MTAAERLKEFNKNCWSYKTIMSYFDVSKATAIKIKNRAIKENHGGVTYGSQYASVDSILSLFGTTVSKEIKRLKEIVGNEVSVEPIQFEHLLDDISKGKEVKV